MTSLFPEATRPPKCPLFVELCAGTGAISLALQAGARPPVSRMGASTGYSAPILGACGLKAGDGAAAYLWCEPDDGVRAMLMAYCLPEVRAEAAEVIWSWTNEDPRALWERLRAEGPIRGVDGGEVARSVYVRAQSWKGMGHHFAEQDPSRGAGVHQHERVRPGELERRLAAVPAQPPTAITPDARVVDPAEVARFLRIVSANRLICVDSQRWMNTGNGGTHHGGDFCTPIDRLAGAVDGLPDDWPEVTICADGRVVDPREVARWTWLGVKAYRQGEPSSGGPVERFTTPEGVAARLNALPPMPPTTITDDARPLHPPRLPEGTVVYFDPPYQGTTGYADKLPREEVLVIAQRWADAGALVVISEACPMGSIVHEGIADAAPGALEGWHCYEITGMRKGQKRTFSKQQREWITLSAPADKLWAAGAALTNRGLRLKAMRPPPAEQASLFGAAL